MSLRSLSGIKPTGSPHLGNYLGMMKPALKLQQQFQTFYFIADYHAMTTLPDPQFLQKSAYDLTASFLALGLSTKGHAFFKQSDIPEVTELAWILACLAHKGVLDRAHAYKDAIAKKIEVNVGLFCYPILMAADILIYDSTHVPVGQDQKQHLEMTRDLALRFNHVYGETFVIPEALIEKEVATIPGIDGQKMSKSYNNTIPLFAEEKKLKKLVMKIVTDSLPVEAQKNPEHCRIFALFKFFSSEQEQKELAKQYQKGGMGYGEAKQICFEAINRELKDARDKYVSFRQDLKTLDGILEQGRDDARKVAQSVMTRVRNKIGLCLK